MVLYITVSDKNFDYIRITCRKFWRNFRIVMYCDDDGTVCFSMTFSTLELRIRKVKDFGKVENDGIVSFCGFPFSHYFRSWMILYRSYRYPRKLI